MFKDAVNKPLVSEAPSDWQQLVTGRKAQLYTQRLLNQCLPQCFGYYGLTLGPLAEGLSMEQSPVRHWFSLCSQVHERTNAVIDYSALPIASDSLDIVVVPHLLDFVDNPHHVLREIERVVIPDGKVILTGVNPLSVYGLRRLGCRIMRKQCREKRLLGLSRMKDWLMLLGFDIHDYIGLDSGAALGKSDEYKRWWFSITSHFNSHYFIMARKRVSTLTPIRPSWRSNRKLVPARFAEPGIRRAVEREIKKYNT